MIEPRITHQTSAEGGRYFIDTAHGRAELDYERTEAGEVAIMRTYSPPAARGRGLARVLVERAVADAAARGDKVLPECSYAAKLFDERPDWARLRVL